jgi:ATP-dependent Clp protease ATP-binding subunit ClpC
MTSNAGTEHLRASPIGFATRSQDAAQVDLKEAQSKVNDALRQTFRPEFLNRIDEVVLFHPLTMEELTSIVDLQVQELSERLQEQRIVLRLSQAAKDLLVREGYSPAYGARPLRRTVQRMIETPLSRSLLKGEFHPGDTVDVDVENGELTFHRQPGVLELEKKHPAAPLDV